MTRRALDDLSQRLLGKENLARSELAQKSVDGANKRRIDMFDAHNVNLTHRKGIKRAARFISPLQPSVVFFVGWLLVQRVANLLINLADTLLIDLQNLAVIGHKAIDLNLNVGRLCIDSTCEGRLDEGL